MRVLWILFAGAAWAATPAESAQQKIDSILQNRAKPGSVVIFTQTEANAWAHAKLPTLIPQGVRNEYLDFGTDVITGAALVDIPKIRRSLGKEPGMVLSRMFEGERPAKATVRALSRSGSVTLSVTRLELGNAVASGAVLDLLLESVVRQIYPGAKINEPIALDYRIDSIKVAPKELRVSIKK